MKIFKIEPMILEHLYKSNPLVRMMIRFSILMLSITLCSCNGGRTFYHANNDVNLKKVDISNNKNYELLDIRKLYYKGDASGMIFLGKDIASYESARKVLLDKATDVNSSKTRCSFMLSYFLPLYPWDIWFYPKKARMNTLRKAFQNAKSSGLEGDILKNIIFKEVWFGGPILSYTCVTASITLAK